MKRFLDTNILLYSISTSNDESAKRSISQGMLEQDGCVLSIQSLNEFCSRAIKGRIRNGITTMMPLPRHMVFAIANEWVRRFHVVELSNTTFNEAQALANLYQLQFFDAMLLAAAIEAGCDEFLTEDSQSIAKIGSLNILNPFISIK